MKGQSARTAPAARTAPGRQTSDGPLGFASARGVRRTALALCVLAALLPGCARRVPLTELGGSRAEVWARVTTVDGEEFTGRLFSLDASALVLEFEYDVTGEFRLSERGGTESLYDGTEKVHGELAGVETRDGVRVAVMRRRFSVRDLESATFHASRGERSLASILSLLVGPAVGGALGLLL